MNGRKFLSQLDSSGSDCTRPMMTMGWIACRWNLKAGQMNFWDNLFVSASFYFHPRSNFSPGPSMLVDFYISFSETTLHSWVNVVSWANGWVHHQSPSAWSWTWCLVSFYQAGVYRIVIQCSSHALWDSAELDKEVDI